MNAVSRAVAIDAQRLEADLIDALLLQDWGHRDRLHVVVPPDGYATWGWAASSVAEDLWPDAPVLRAETP